MGGGKSSSATYDNRTYNYQGGSNDFSNFFGNFNYKGTGYFNSSSTAGFNPNTSNKNTNDQSGGAGSGSSLDLAASVGVGIGGGSGSAGAVDKTANSTSGNNSTLLLVGVGVAAAFAIVAGIVLGSTAALMRNRWPDRVIVFFITLITAMPSFVVATLLLYFFCMKLGWVSAFNAGSNMTLLPVVALSMSPMAYITRLTKTSMLDALGQDYIRTAKAKGVSQLKVIFIHGLRNALIPVITYVGPMIAGILTGSMVVESIFNIGGLGSKFVSAITNRDYTLIMATTIFLAVIMVIANLITDIIYKVVDPRIKLD